MERITITIDDDLLATVDMLVKRHGYPNRSEAIRELVRESANRINAKASRAPCVATLSYVFDHHMRDLPQRLTEEQHAHHEISIATTHVHFDHDTCLEVSILRGPIDAVRKFSDSVTTQRGVRHSYLHLIPVKTMGHSHGPGTAPHSHSVL
jgi:CopG family nickel-responsive transcriptional regulator